MAEIKDFDAEQLAEQEQDAKEFGDKPFTFRGETFHVRPSVKYGVIKSVAGIAEADDGNRVFSVIEEAVLSLIDPRDDAHERFRQVCDQEKFPVTFKNLISLLNWLIEEQTGRPPTPAANSSNGSTVSGTPSTVISSEGPVAA